MKGALGRFLAPSQGDAGDVGPPRPNARKKSSFYFLTRCTWAPGLGHGIWTLILPHACLQVFGLGIGFGAPRGVGVGGGAVWAPERAVGSLPCQPLWHIYDAKIAELTIVPILQGFYLGINGLVQCSRFGAPLACAAGYMPYPFNI